MSKKFLSEKFAEKFTNTFIEYKIRINKSDLIVPLITSWFVFNTATFHNKYCNIS